MNIGLPWWVLLLVFVGLNAVWDFTAGFSRTLAGFRRCSLCRVWRRGTKRLVLDVVFKETTKSHLDWVICSHCLRCSFAESMKSLAEGLIKATDAVDPQPADGAAS